MPDTLWYFAYGSNMQRATFLERRGMHPLEWRRARLPDHCLCFNLPIGDGERGVANVEPAVGAEVIGVAFRLTTAEFDFLDKTEGVDSGVYERVAAALRTEDGNALGAFTYRSRLITEGRKPSPRYMGLILEGAREHGLSDEYIRSLHDFELAIDERVEAEND